MNVSGCLAFCWRMRRIPERRETPGFSLGGANAPWVLWGLVKITAVVMGAKRKITRRWQKFPNSSGSSSSRKRCSSTVLRVGSWFSHISFQPALHESERKTYRVVENLQITRRLLRNLAVGDIALEHVIIHISSCFFSFSSSSLAVLRPRLSSIAVCSNVDRSSSYPLLFFPSSTKKTTSNSKRKSCQSFKNLLQVKVQIIILIKKK